MIEKQQRLLDGYKFYIYGDAKGRTAEFKLKDEVGLLISLPADYVTDDTLLLYRCYESLLNAIKDNNSIANYDYFDAFSKDLEKSSVDRAPGDAILSACNEHKPLESSKGSGALGRVPVYCLLLHLGYSFDKVAEIVKEDSVLSHVDPATVRASINYLALYYLLAFNKRGSAPLYRQVNKFVHEIFEQNSKFMDLYDFDAQDSLDYVKGHTDVWLAADIFDYICFICEKASKPFNLMRDAICIDGDSDSVAALIGFLIPWLFDEFTVNNYKNLIWQEIEADSEVAKYSDLFWEKLLEFESSKEES